MVDKDSFRQAVYDIVTSIPEGRATSYGAIAKAVGYPQHSRLVGHIIASCEDSEKIIPAHRVVNSQGYLSGKDSFSCPGEMQKRLQAEGVEVINDKIKNWKKIFWNPLLEITIE